jgi:Na+/H+ antiporter NhaD/arsenite permease-like protein
LAFILQIEPTWIALAMTSTPAGKLSVFVSVANLIIVDNSRRIRTDLGVLRYIKLDVPLTVLTTIGRVA